MSHIVIHDDSSNVTHYVEFDDLEAAASYLEDLANDDAASDARLFALEPVEFAVKSYVKIEIGTAASSPASAPEAVEVTAESEVDTETPAASAEVFTDATVDDTVEYVEAAMTPVDSFAATPMPERLEDAGSGDSRRGLFGR